MHGGKGENGQNGGMSEPCKRRHQRISKITLGISDQASSMTSATQVQILIPQRIISLLCGGLSPGSDHQNATGRPYTGRASLLSAHNIGNDR